MQNSKLTYSQIHKKFLVLQDQLLDYDIDCFRMTKYKGNVDDNVFSFKAKIGKYSELIHFDSLFLGVGFIIKDQSVQIIAKAILDNEARMELIDLKMKNIKRN